MDVTMRKWPISANILLGMEQLLQKLTGRKIDVSCGATHGFRGDVLEVTGGVLKMLDEDEQTIYIAIEKIAAVGEVNDSHARPGFIGK